MLLCAGKHALYKIHCFAQIRKRDGVNQQNTQLKFQGLEPPQENNQQENGEGMEQQQQPPMRGMVNILNAYPFNEKKK